MFAPKSLLAGIAAPGHHGVTGQTGVTLTELSGLTLASLTARRGRAAALSAALPMTPSRVAQGAMAFICSGPDRWLVVGAPSDDMLGKLAASVGALGSITDLTGSRTIIRVAGPRARDCMMKLVPIDLDDSVFSAGSAALTVAARIPVQIWQLDATPTYDIACPRSYGVSLWHALLAACAEYGCDVRA